MAVFLWVGFTCTQRVVSSILNFGAGEAIFPCLPTFFHELMFLIIFTLAPQSWRVLMLCSLPVFYLISSEDLKYMHSYMNSTSSVPFLYYSEIWWGLFRHQIVDGRWISPSCRWFPDFPMDLLIRSTPLEETWTSEAPRYTLSLIHSVTGWLRLPHSEIWFSYL